MVIVTVFDWLQKKYQIWLMNTKPSVEEQEATMRRLWALWEKNAPHMNYEEFKEYVCGSKGKPN